MAVNIKNALFKLGQACSELEYGRLSDMEHATWPALTAMMEEKPTNTTGDEMSGEESDSSSDTFFEKDVESQMPSKGNSSSNEEDSNRFRVSPRVISDAIIGLSDGLTVPFALTAGLSALGNAKTVVYGGLAELIAGSISMGLGGYLGAKSEIDSYYATLGETQETISTSPEEIKEKVSSLLISHDVSADLAEQVTEQLSSSPKYTDFVLQFVHSMAEPPPKRAFSCALTIALGYFVGGFIPLVPYFFVAQDDVRLGLMCSAIIMICTLFAFGYGKTGIVHGWAGMAKKRKAIFGGLEMVLIGTLAAGAAMGLVYSFTHE